MKYMIGIKCGMTRIFNDIGNSIPVTIIYVEDNRIIYTYKNNYKNFVQITYGKKIIKNINKPEIGHFNKNNVIPGIIIKSFIYKDNDININNSNKTISINNFKNTKIVNITGTSKGKGFSGVIKRWNFSSQDASHGNSLSHRAPGSIGQNQSPGRVFKGKKMSGHQGNKRITIKNLKVFKIDEEKKLLFVKGSTPGYNSNILIIKFVF